MNTADRQLARCQWARTALNQPDAVLEPASADASFRSYWRVRDGGTHWIVMDAPPAQEDIRPWLDVAARLSAAGLHVPQVRHADAEHGFVLMSDLGNALMLPALNANSVDALYGNALDALLGNAAAQPQVFVHRDFHSRNLMIGTGNDPGIIDFQDAVRGPISYDLVSLLRDCYIAWPEERVYAWVEAYRQRALAAGLTDVNGATFRRWFDLMGLQRHLKVLGIFCRLWYRDGKRAYLDDLPLVWRYARDVGRQYDATAPLITLLERAIGGRDLSHVNDAA